MRRMEEDKRNQQTAAARSPAGVPTQQRASKQQKYRAQPPPKREEVEKLAASANSSKSKGRSVADQPPGGSQPCPKCCQPLALKPSQDKFGCPACRGIFLAATGDHIGELVVSSNGQVAPKLYDWFLESQQRGKRDSQASEALGAAASVAVQDVIQEVVDEEAEDVLLQVLEEIEAAEAAAARLSDPPHDALHRPEVADDAASVAAAAAAGAGSASDFLDSFVSALDDFEKVGGLSSLCRDSRGSSHRPAFVFALALLVRMRHARVSAMSLD